MTLPTAAQDDISTSWLGSIPVGQVVIFVVAVVGFAIWAWRVGYKLRKLSEPLSNFLRDWNGEPARPGVPERPGVMARIARIENQTRDIVARDEFEKLRDKVASNTFVVDLVRPYVVVDLPKDPKEGQP